MRSTWTTILTATFFSGIALAQPVQYDEAVDGDIPFIEGVGWPLTLTLAPGENTVTGVLSQAPGSTDQDGFNLIVPDGAQIESVEYQYTTTFYVNNGVASYNFYLDGAGSPSPFETVRVSETLSDTRDFYTDQMPLGPGEYRIGRQGSAINNENEYDVAYTYTITVSGDDPEPPQITEVMVPYQRIAPALDGVISANEWRTAPQIPLANGNITVVHDEIRLYFLVNMREDRTDNSFRDGGPDQVWFLADVDEDEAITPNLDRRYRMLTGTGNFRYETYAASGGPPLNPPAPRTFSALAEGFGCFLADGSATVIPSLSCDNHRVWEVGLDLLELRAMDDKTVRLGLLVQTELDQVETLPTDLTDFTTFVDFQLQGDTATTGFFGSTPENIPDVLNMRITQGIQTATNSLDLVAERDAYVDVLAVGRSRTENPIVTVFATRDGVDLPGSPFTQRQVLRYNADRDPPIQDNWRIRLGPDETYGQVTFDLAARLPLLQTSIGGTDFDVNFVPAETPTYWIVPVTTGSGSGQRPRTSFLDRQELETRAVLPVPDIDFVRRPAITGDPANEDGAIALMNQYDQQTVLAWTMGLLFTGEAPFTLPDQVIGAFGQEADFTGFAGQANPEWLEGNGRTLWMKDADIEVGLLLAHEINHNLDLDSAGSWGRHVMGCGASGVDPQWPYVNKDIQERGLVAEPVLDEDGFNLMPPRPVPADMPDYMSYCRFDYSILESPQQAYPYQWMSPYRWQRQLDNVFRTDPLLINLSLSAVAPATGVQDSLYISGMIGTYGSGSLAPVLRQPGIVDTPPARGDYAIRLLDCAGLTLATQPFNVSFTDVEGRPRQRVPFAMTLPDSAALCAVQLQAGETLIAERVLTANAPAVTLLSPNGGENWDGMVTARWAAADADGDALTASLFYSADAGATWLPVAADLSGSEYGLDTAGLPGSAQAKLRIIVTDGFNTTRDDSDGLFIVADKPPAVQIIGPDGGAPLFAGERQRFTGVARDAAGNRLPADDFLWRLDGEAVGIGNPLELVLEPGVQQLVLAVMAENGLTGEATLSLNALGFDDDADGVPDDVDSCPDSDPSPTVVVNDCDSEVENRVTSTGCNVGDLLSAAFDPEEPGARSARAAIRALRSDGIVSQSEWLDIQLCLRPSVAQDNGPN